MSPIWGHVAGVITLLLMLTFIGIWIWAWSGRHKRVFKRMSEIPLDELDDKVDAHGTPVTRTCENPLHAPDEQDAPPKKEQS